jgi:hypothetical protein
MAQKLHDKDSSDDEIFNKDAGWMTEGWFKIPS